MSRRFRETTKKEREFIVTFSFLFSLTLGDCRAEGAAAKAHLHELQIGCCCNRNEGHAGIPRCSCIVSIWYRPSKRSHQPLNRWRDCKTSKILSKCILCLPSSTNPWRNSLYSRTTFCPVICRQGLMNRVLGPPSMEEDSVFIWTWFKL